MDTLWNGTFYQTGLGHFDYFWVRDFGSVVDSLLATGNRERVLKTLEWACDCYMKSGAVRLCIDKNGFVFDLPERSIDALPWLMYCLQRSGFEVSEGLRTLLETEAERYTSEYLTYDGSVRQDVNFSELRDGVRYHASAYAVTMVAVLARTSRALGIRVALPGESFYADLLRRTYWNGTYLRADMRTEGFAAECNLFAVHLGVLPEDEFRDGILDTMAKKGLCTPYPVRYTDSRHLFDYRWWARTLMADYAADTVWSWLGGIYLQLLRRRGDHEAFDSSERLYASMVERYGTLPELLTREGNWYETAFYRGEEGMIWAALYLALHLGELAVPLKDSTPGVLVS